VGDESILVDNTEPSAQRSEGFATSGESDSQTDETSFLSDFSPSDIDALQDETGEVDPVSEADVYMAYNRYQQAEELLRQAVRREPERAELRFKLLDVLFAAQAADAFVNEAEDLAGAGAPREHPDEWRRVVSMGQDLAPEHPLFVDQEPSIGEETAMVGEQGEAHDLGDLDLGDIESELEAASGQSGWSDEERERPREAAVASAASAEPGSDGGDDWGVSDLEIESSSDFIAESEPALGEEPREESEFDFSELGDLDTRISGEAVEEGPYGAGRGEDASLSVDEAVGQVDIGGDLRDGDAKDALGTSSPDLEVDRMESIPDEDIVQIGGLDSALSELEASEDLALEEADTGAAAEQEPDLELPEMGEEDEVATKLDLARAYMDMGDEEGARSILDEVMAEGSDVQQSEARGLMERLA
jgi:pilus assembly protein FimV